MALTRRRLAKILAAAALLGVAPWQAALAVVGGFAPTSTGGGGSAGTLTQVNYSGSTVASGSVAQSTGWFFAQGVIPAIAVTTGSVSSGSNSLIVASAAGMATNQTILIDGVPTGTHITNVSGTTITLSQNATANVSGGAVVVPGAPKLAIGGVAQLYSWGLHVLHADNSLRFCVLAVKLGSTIAGSASQGIVITSGGSHPTPSGYTFTDFYNEAVVVTAVASSISNANLSGTWHSYLLGDANNWSKQIELDGDAGMRCKFITHMAQTSGGAAHGQLECEHEMWKFPGASGAEIRWRGHIIQPWYNVVSPAINYRVFASASWTMNGGSANQIGMLGAQNYTVSGGQAAIGSGAYYRGAANGPSGVPGVVSSSGSVDSALSVNNLYWLGQNSATNNITFYTDTNLQTAVSLNSNGTGTQTFTPLPTSVPFVRLTFAQSGANVDTKYWHWATGATSTSADVTLRHQIDQAAWIAAGFAPFTSSLGFAPATSTTVVDTTYSYHWDPFNIADFDQSQGAPGDRASIGLFPNQHVVHFYTQSAASEALIRIGGLSGSLWADNFLDNSTGNLLNFLGPGASYRGMPAYDTNTPGWPNGAAGFTAPTTRTVVYEATNGLEHQPNYWLWPYAFTGERIYLDIGEEQANGAILQNVTRLDFRNPAGPSAVLATFTNNPPYGFGTINGEFRTMAWALRNTIGAAAVSPTIHPDGSQRSQYLRDLAAQNIKFPYEMMVAANNYYTPSPGSSAAQSYITSTGNHVPADYDAGAPNPFTGAAMSLFELPYFISAMCLAASLLGDSNAKAWLKNMVTFFNYTQSKFGVWPLLGYYQAVTLNWPTISLTSDAGFGVLVGGWFVDGGGSMNWNSAGMGGAPSGQKFQWSALAQGYTPAVGDQYTYDLSVTGLPANMASDTRDTTYYLVNVSGSYFDLSRSKGGSALTPTGSGSFVDYNSWYVATAYPGPSTGSACFNILDAQNGPADMLGVANWVKHLGITGLDNVSTMTPVITAINTQIVNSGGPIDFTAVPKYAWAA